MTLDIDTLLPLFGVQDAEPLTSAQRDTLRARYDRLSSHGILLSEGAIIFTDGETHKNWCYYGGFEYVEQQHITMVQQGEDLFLAIYSTGCSRVSEVHATLNPENSTDDAEDATPAEVATAE